MEGLGLARRGSTEPGAGVGLGVYVLLLIVHYILAIHSRFHTSSHSFY